MAATTYPVHVDAHLDPGLSRWQWLVKWLLAIPHFVVLLFLWMAFVVLSIFAMFAILFTGRYPRAVFDFNVGVLRWTWRVNYYAYGALATDRYPPFTLAEVPDYPAHLTIDYPEHLSQGLVLVKWWLLAIPHYLVLSIFVGGGTYAATRVDDNLNSGWSTGLIGLLVLIAAVALLFTGRYPQAVFDLVLGLNRWVLRVAAYAGLMTDQYPPFRLDQGGDDPDGGRLAMSAPAAPPAPAGSTTPPVAGPGAGPGAGPPTPPGTGTPGAHRWSVGRVLAVVIGSVIVLGSVGLGLGATALLVADQTMRDDGGFLMSDTQGYATGGYAISTPNVQIETDASVDVPHAILGDAKISASSAKAAPIFVGVARTADARAYLRNVRHATLSGWTDDRILTARGSGAPTTLPTDTDIWVAQASGRGTQSVTWPVKKGDWTVVVMNADGSAGVRPDLAVGATVPAIGGLIAGMYVVAVVGLVIGVTVVALGIRAASSAR